MTKMMGGGADGLRAFQLFNLAFGVAVGIGWIMVMGAWLEAAGPLGSLTAFAATGAVMLTVAYSYAAVAIESPVAGGEFVYATRAFGARVGMWVGWFLALAYVVVIAFEMVSLPWVIRELVPGLPPAPSGSWAFDPVGLMIGSTALLGVILFNLKGAATATRLQDTLVLVKVVLSLLLLVAGLIFGEVRNLTPLWGEQAAGSAAPGILAVLAMAPFFYSGFGVISQAVGEVRKPETIRRLPWVMAMIIVGTALFYILIILASAMAAPRALTLGASLPASAAFAHISPLLGKVVLLLGILGLLTILNGIYFAAVRLIQTLADAGLLPGMLGRLEGQDGISTNAGLFVAGVSILFAVSGKAMLAPFLNVASAVFSAVMAVVCLVLIRHRLGARHWRSQLAPLIGALLTTAMVITTMVEAVRASPFAIAPEWLVIVGWAFVGFLFGFARDRRDIACGHSR